MYIYHFYLVAVFYFRILFYSSVWKKFLAVFVSIDTNNPALYVRCQSPVYELFTLMINYVDLHNYIDVQLHTQALHLLQYPQRIRHIKAHI